MNAQQSTDEATLSAWLDGALEGDQLAAVHDALARSPELQRRIGLMMLNERLVRARFEQMAAERPVPETLASLLDTQSNCERKSWLRLFNDRLAGMTLGPGLATAVIAVALLVGVLAGQQVPFASAPFVSMPSNGLARIEIGHPWHDLLESTASGTSVALDDGRQGLVALTYESTSGRWCRQFQISGSQRVAGTAAVACRDDGLWQIELAQRFEAPAATGDRYQTAGAPGLSAVDAYILARRRGEVLVGSQEAAVLDQGWQ